MQLDRHEVENVEIREASLLLKPLHELFLEVGPVELVLLPLAPDGLAPVPNQFLLVRSESTPLKWLTSLIRPCIADRLRWECTGRETSLRGARCTPICFRRRNRRRFRTICAPTMYWRIPPAAPSSHCCLLALNQSGTYRCRPGHDPPWLQAWTSCFSFQAP